MITTDSSFKFFKDLGYFLVVAKRVEETHSAAFARCRVSLQIHIHHENPSI